MVLVVVPAEHDISQQTATTQLDHPPGQVTVAPLAGQSGQLDERRLDLRVTADGIFTTLAEATHQQVSQTASYVQQVGVSCDTRRGDSGLDKVARAVHLMTPL